MHEDLSHLRKEYTRHGLDVSDLAATPVEQFRAWFTAACEGGVESPDAMTLATSGADGRPSARIVLLKGRLTIDGTIPLAPDGELFRLRDNPHNTEWIRFGEVVNGRCMHIRFSGSDLWRVAAA